MLSQGGRYEIFEEYGSAYLEIYESEVSDTGVYKCTAVNSAGTVSTTCTVTVRGKIYHLTVVIMNLQLQSFPLFPSINSCICFRLKKLQNKN